MTQAAPSSSSLNIPPDVAERLRVRRTGYDQVRELVKRYDGLSPDERSSFQELQVTTQFVWPMFIALGWDVKAEAPVRSSTDGPNRADIILTYRDLNFPVEIKRFQNQLDDQSASQLLELARSIGSSWGILTNFESISIFAYGSVQSAITKTLRSPDIPLLETSPYAYILDEDEKHDLLAAPIFYERLVKTQSSDAAQQKVQQQNITQPSFDTAQDKRNAPPTEKLEVASRALADAPSAVDLLGFADYADALADFIKSEKTEKPLTIGIDAPWGMGKTTLMQMIRDRLVTRDAAGKSQRAFPTVWFNAWRFDAEKSLWAALALAILNETRGQLNGRQRAQLWFTSRLAGLRQFDTLRVLQNFLRLAAYFIIILGLGYAAVTVLGLNASLPQSIQDLQARGGLPGTLIFLASLYLAGKELLERVLKSFDIKIVQFSDVTKSITEERVNFLSQFEEDFQAIAAILTEGGKWPIVVFIDDLERCTPPRPAEIMEAINLFLGSRYTIFVIGMDAQMVAGSIESKYKDLTAYLAEVEAASGVTLGQRFVEKIVQLNFQIPRSDPEKFASFIGANLSASKTEEAKPSQEQVAHAEQLIKAEQRTGKSLDEAAQVVQTQQANIPAPAIAQARQEIFAKSFDDSTEVRDAIRMATPYMGFNPRKLKRFINNFRLQALVTNRRGLLNNRTIELSLLAKWMIIVTRWPDLVDALESDAQAAQHLKETYRIREQLRAAPVDTQGLQTRLAQLVENKRLNRLGNSADLMTLLNDMSDAEIDALPTYLQLAQIGVASRQ